MGRFLWQKLTFMFILTLILASCNPFSRLKRKYGKLEDTVQVPYVRSIPPDSVLLQIGLPHLVPGRPISKRSGRSGITIFTDESGKRLTAQANCDPIYIRDKIRFGVEKLVFHEADFSGYISKKEAAKL